MVDSGNLYHGVVEFEIMLCVQTKGIYFILGRSSLLYLGKVWDGVGGTKECLFILCI